MSIFESKRACLLLSDGTVYEGRAFGAEGLTVGEVVFNTSMTGYQEILTDPSYRRQMVVMTYPHIGNYGVNARDSESDAVHPTGFIVRDICETPSNWRSEGSLGSWLDEHGVVGICGIDTRALVRKIRNEGAMLGAIMSGEVDMDRLEAALKAEPPMAGRDLVGEVTCAAPYRWQSGIDPLVAFGEADPSRSGERYRVVAYDFGVKHNILRLLHEHGCDVTVVPSTTSAQDALAYKPDGIFLSNGPGDPSAVDYAVKTVRALIGQVPIFGICLGHQLTALALGATTYKMTFGNRGGNQPVMDLDTKKVEITSQNHGFAVNGDSLASGARVSHINLNDQTVEGLVHDKYPVFTVQYHPEASPGPRDADYLFKRFVSLMARAR
ncbi:MAG: glutamine-hydrolyzing carbamoyl-phosphate synthase small subunit [Myxococcota bacterium]|nr:glutamine-hydrolyzing carbamoyl-phosphate synthase small subunit [Myxococcota bacterium]